MKIIFLGEKEKSVKLENVLFTKNCLTLLGCGYLPELSLDEELRGNSNYIKTLCSISMENNLIFLAPTSLYCGRKKFFGTLVIDNGKFLGISDMTHSPSSLFDKSNTLRVFDTSMGRFGIISGEDINYFEVSRLMKLWECDCIFFGVGEKINRKNKILAEAQGYINETTAVLFGSNGVKFFNSKSLVKERANTFNLTARSNTLLIDSRRRELYRDLVIR